MEEHKSVLECKNCDIHEDGTINGRFDLGNVQWNWYGETIKFFDHSVLYLPSPDVTSDSTGRDIPVLIAES